MGARIVIVEDEQIIAVDLESRLKRLGHEVLGIAITGEEAIVMAEQYQPDIIFMDIRLRGPMNGLQAATTIRALRKMPIIFVTAFADALPRDAQQPEPLSVYMKKPFTAVQLKDALSAALKSA